MKPFDLEAALAGAPVVTRKGGAVTQLVKLDCKDDFSVVGVSPEGWLNTWKVNGKKNPYGDSAADLFMKSQKKKLWIQVSTSTLDDCFGGIHATTNARGIRPSITSQGCQIVEVEIDV